MLVNKLSAGRISSPILGTYVSRDPGRYNALITKFCTHRFLSPIVGNVGIFETIEGVEELFDQTSEIAEIQESMGVCRIRRRMVG